MAKKVVSRTQRRMERKHAVTLVLLVLVVSLASFSLGVMVGRGGNQESPQAARTVQPLTLPQAGSAPVSAAQVASTPATESTESAVPAATDPAGAADKLTFYDTLPRGDQPLGSGINLPPQAESQAPAEPVARLAAQAPSPPAGARVKKPVASSPSPPVASVAAPALSLPVGQGYVVQIASFQKPAQASALRNRLAGKGYVTFVKSADLGSKGTWHRVYAGPYSERRLADKAAGRLHKEEKFSPLVRKR